MINHYSHETFPHFGRLGSHQSNRYYHQDPHYRLFHVASRLDASELKSTYPATQTTPLVPLVVWLGISKPL